MIGNFSQSLDLVLKSEGGWSDRADDKGGPTMKGITLQTFQNYKRNPYASKDDLRNISDKDVSEIYRVMYWDKCRCDDLPNGVDYFVFDFAVNAGVGRSNRTLQGCVGTTVDGIVGSKTLAAASVLKPQALIDSFSNAKEEFYKSLDDFKVYGKGWLNRVAQVKANALEML